MAKTLLDIIPVGPDDRVISYLPLSHIAEQVVYMVERESIRHRFQG